MDVEAVGVTAAAAAAAAAGFDFDTFGETATAVDAGKEGAAPAATEEAANIGIY